MIGASAGALDGICVGALDDGAVVGGTGRAGVGSTGGTADGNVGVCAGGIDGEAAGARPAACWSDHIAMPRRYHRSWNTIGMGMWTATTGNREQKLEICFNCSRSMYKMNLKRIVTSDRAHR
jgi:hypothetical protein